MSIITLAGCKLPKNCAVQSPMKLHNVIYFRQSDLKYAKNDLKVCKNDLKYYDLKWDFPLGGLILHDTYTLEHNLLRRQSTIANWKDKDNSIWMGFSVTQFTCKSFVNSNKGAVIIYGRGQCKSENHTYSNPPPHQDSHATFLPPLRSCPNFVPPLIKACTEILPPFNYLELKYLPVFCK